MSEDLNIGAEPTQNVVPTPEVVVPTPEVETPTEEDKPVE